MDGESYLRFVLALVLVLGLLALAAFLLRRSGIAPKMGRGRRLSTVESLALGPRHRLVLVRRDAVEHLLLIGPQGDVVVEAGIGSTAQRSQAPARETAMPNDPTPADQDRSHPAAPSFEAMLDGRADTGPGTAPHMTSTNEQH